MRLCRAPHKRKSFNGLSGIARELLGATPSSRDLYLFCNRGRNRLKVLVYDESGDREEQLMLLLRGVDAEALKPRRWSRRAAS